MLLRLTVTDFALLHKAEISFLPGLTAITGETGAGKSLLVGALAFLAGGKPPFDVVRENARHAVVEGEFQNTGKITTILRRQISSDGRSRAFIDDEPVNQKDLAEVTASLLDITSQRAFSRLLDSHYHLDLLDSFANLRISRTALQKYHADFHRLQSRKNELEQFIVDQKTHREYVRKQLNEIDILGIIEGEEIELAAEIKRLEHFEELHRDGSRVAELLSGGRDAVEAQLMATLKLIEHISELDATLVDLKQEMDETLLTVREVTRRVKERCRPGGYEAAKLEEMRQRQHNLTSIARKFGGSLETLIQKREEFRKELTAGSKAENELEDVNFNIAKVEKEWVMLAKEVSQIRKEAAQKIDAKVTESLKELGIGDPRFEVRLEQTSDTRGLIESGGTRWRLTERGAEDAVFYFSGNAGIESKPLATVASGGELSRIMLALKESLPLQSEEATILFDEIDTGVSGKTARLVGKKMKKISKGRQLFVITHLPQIASLADNHLNVVKSDHNGTTITSVISLKGDDRVREVAAMLSDGKVSTEALEQARYLISEQ